MKTIYPRNARTTNLLRRNTFRFVLCLMSCLPFQILNAQTISVTQTADVVNGNTTNIASLTASNGGDGVSLREAVLAANGEPVGANITINVAAGTYTLTLSGAAENVGVSGDLDLNTTVAAGMKTVTVNGVDSNSTIFQVSGTSERFFEIHSINNPGSITFNLNRVRIQNVVIANSGAAILAGRPGDNTNIDLCAFNGNSAINGGAISKSSSAATHHLTVTNSSFTNNTASGAGGAINYSGQGIVTITNCKFASNTNTAGTGGAINLTGGGVGTYTLSRNTFINNRVLGGGQGGAVAHGVGDAVMIYNRFINNTAATPTNGNTLYQAGGDPGHTIIANDNWWGVNTGPPANSTAVGTAPVTAPVTATWLQLRASASPSAVCVNATSTVTASFLTNSAGTAIAAGNLTALVGLPVTFSATLGSLSSAQPTIQASGTATVTYTAGAVAGSGTVNAVVDNVPNTDPTARATITINGTPAITTNPSDVTQCPGLAATFTGASATATSFTWQESTDAAFTTPTTLTNTGVYSGTTTTTLTISNNTGLGGRYYRMRAFNSCGPTNSTGALLTVTAPTLSTSTTVTQPVTSNNGYVYGASCAIITRIVPSGASPVSGNVTSQVWVQGTVPTYGSNPYVQRHYQVTPAVNPATATATVTLYFSQTEFNNFNAHPGSINNLPTGPADAAGIANLRVAKYNGTSTDGTGRPNTYPAGATILNPVDANIVFNATFSRWEVTLDIVGGGGLIVQTALIALPVNLVSFSGQRVNNDIQLKWKTASETFNDFFDVERSLDGRNFVSIGRRFGNNGNSVTNYDLIDAGAATQNVSKIYYRLRIVSMNGEIEYSNTVVIHLNKQAVLVTGILPNPFVNELGVMINAPKGGGLTLTVFDITGRVVLRQQAEIGRGSNTISINGVSKLSSGVYTLQVDFEGDRSTHKIVK